MSFGQTQIDFTVAIGKLIEYANRQGYGLTFGDAYRDPRAFGKIGVDKLYSHPNSNHKRRLAVDFNLFVDGKYVGGWNNAWKDLHDKWILLGGATMIDNDYGHFSFAYNGMR